MKVNIEIEDLLVVKQQNESIGNRLEYLNEKLKKLTIKEKAYKQRTDEELADVKRLEELGLRSLFKKVIGGLSQAVEKERKEYLAAVLKHKSIEEEIEILKYEGELLQSKYVDPLKLENELSALIKKKEFQLKSHDTKFTKELFKRESELGRYKLLNHKAAKSIKLADASLKIVREIKSELLEVKGWPLMGKGKYASILKKKYIDRARVKAIKANVQLEEFGESVKMLYRERKLVYDMEPFVDFIDHFYDNLITDYTIKKQIKVTLDDLVKTLNDVEINKDYVGAEQKTYLDLIAQREAELEEFILTYKK